MIYSELLNSCGINAWLQNSIVRVATAPSAVGPYSPQPLVDDGFGLFSHEPTLAYDRRRRVSVVFYTHSAVLDLRSITQSVNVCSNDS